jgi:hypothetical protein
LLPPAIGLVASAGPLMRPRIAAAVLAVVALVSLVGVRDHLQYNSALWTAVDFVRSQGIAVRDVDGGWAINGWFQYAHPENAVRAPNGEVRVNWVNEDSIKTPYQIANTARPGWTVLASFPYSRWASPSGAIHVLHRGEP